MSPDTKWLFLRFLFLTTDVWNDISNHFRPILESLTSTGNSLICSSNYFIWLELFPCSKYRSVTLNRTVWLNSYETALCAEALLLIFDYLHVLWIDFRNYHRYIRCPTMCAVVRNNRCFCLSVIFLDLLDFFLCHIYSRKYEVNF